MKLRSALGPSSFRLHPYILMLRVDIYSKPGCHLCEEAKAVLQRVNKDFPFELREINIELSEEHYQAYKDEIPVIFIDGKKAFKYRVDEKELRKRLARYR